jgi:alkylhydroperoxidase family enzyme
MSWHHCIVVAACLVATGTVDVAPVSAQAIPQPPGRVRPPVPKAPRVAPLPEAQWTAEHKALAAKYVAGGRPGNAFRTLLHIPALVNGMMPFHNYLRADSSLTPRHRELLILRTAWLLNSDYIWSERAAAAASNGLSNEDLRRVAVGPSAPGWSGIEPTLLRLADQLFANSSIADATWRELTAAYDLQHVMDAAMTVAGITTEALVYNSLGVQPDASAAARIPADVPYRVSVPAREPALTKARVDPVPGDGLAVTRTFARYPKLAAARTGSNYVNQGSKLEPRYRELLILRTGWDAQSEYEWAQHVGRVGRAREMGLPIERIAAGPDAPGWDPFEATLLRAADELYRDSVVSDATWKAMAARFDTTMMLNALITAANYRMVSMALNAFGVQLDPGDERFPVIR